MSPLHFKKIFSHSLNSIYSAPVSEVQQSGQKNHALCRLVPHCPKHPCGPISRYFNIIGGGVCVCVCLI